MAVAFASLSTTTGSLPNWILLWALILFASFWVQTTAWTSAVASRFENSRGLAFAVTLSGGSLAAALFPPLATAFIGQFGWRGAFLGLGALWGVLVAVVVVKQRAQASARRLQVQRIPLYQIHQSNPVVLDSVIMPGMRELLDDGVIGAVGVSNYSLAR